MGDETTYYKIACTSCSENVEFPAEMRGRVVDCPHCTLSLILELPGTPPPPAPAPTTAPPENLYQRLRALNNLEAKPAAINLPEAFHPRPESRA